MNRLENQNQLSQQESPTGNLSQFMMARELENQETVKKVTDSLDSVGIDDNYIFIWLFKRIFLPSIILTDGQFHFDYSTSLKNIKQFWKLRWYIKWKITLEELFWMDFSKNNKDIVTKLLSESWNTFRLTFPDKWFWENMDKEVYKQLKKINEEAYFIVRIWKEDFARSPDNWIRTQAHQEMIKLKQYMSDDDSSTVLNFFKVDVNKQEKILSLL